MEKFQTSDISGILLWMAGGWTGYCCNKNSKDVVANAEGQVIIGEVNQDATAQTRWCK